jgi:NADPH2:quinone reductase
MVVQMARAVNAKVITTVGSPEKKRAAEKLGADFVLNYKSDDIAAAIRDFTRGAGVDVWFETLREPNFEQSFDLLRKRGRMIVIVWREARPPFPMGKFYPKDLTLYGFSTFNASSAELSASAEEINRWLAERKLRPLVGEVLPLARAARAHRLQEEHTDGKGGRTGKIILQPPR